MEASQHGHKHPTLTLASWRVAFSLNIWLQLALRVKGPNIRVMIGGAEVASVADQTHKSGMAAIGSGWSRAEFDNFTARPQ